MFKLGESPDFQEKTKTRFPWRMLEESNRIFFCGFFSANLTILGGDSVFSRKKIFLNRPTVYAITVAVLVFFAESTGCLLVINCWCAKYEILYSFGLYSFAFNFVHTGIWKGCAFETLKVLY